MEEVALLGNLLENEDDDFVSKRWREALVEVLEFLLTVLRLLGILEVADNVLLQILGHIHILHCCIGQIDRLLKFSVL